MGLWAWLPGAGQSAEAPAISPPPPAPPTLSPPTPPTPSVKLPTEAAPLTTFERTRKQLTLYVAGSAFLLLTTRLALKSLARRYASTRPKFYTTNGMAMKHQQFNGGKDAFEALNIATLGVASVGMITVGGTMFALDIVSIEEARGLVRQKYGTQGRKTDQEVEEELEEWVASVLARKEKREKESAEKA